MNIHFNKIEFAAIIMKLIVLYRMSYGATCPNLLYI